MDVPKPHPPVKKSVVVPILPEGVKTTTLTKRVFTLNEHLTQKAFKEHEGLQKLAEELHDAQHEDNKKKSLGNYKTREQQDKLVKEHKKRPSKSNYSHNHQLHKNKKFGFKTSNKEQS